MKVSFASVFQRAKPKLGAFSDFVVKVTQPHPGNGYFMHSVTNRKPQS